MWQALPYALDYAPNVTEAVHDWLARQDIKRHDGDAAGKPVSQVAGELRTHLQLDRMERSRQLRGFDDPSRWERSIIQMDRSLERMAAFVVSQGLPLNTTNGERYGPAEVVRQLMSNGRDPVDMWDGGSSILIGVNQIAQKRRYPFAMPHLQRRVGEAAGRPLWVPEDKNVEWAYRMLLGAPEVPGRFVSMDIFHPRDRIIREVARAALRPVSEIQNRRFMHRFHALAGEKLPSDVVGFQQGDITDRRDVRRIRERFPDFKCRVAFAGTVFNQLGEDKIPDAVDAMMDVLDDRYEDALVLALDFVYVDPNDRSRIRLHPRWGLGTYALIGVYKNDPQRRAREFFRFASSRPSEVEVGPDEIMVNGAFMSVRQALLERAADVSARGSGRGPKGA
nr:Unknown Function [uncultured bacterium]